MTDPIANRAHDLFPVLVANVREDSKHFSRGAKVYVLPGLWGDGGESLTVFGHHKGSRGKRMTRIVVRGRLLQNFRVQCSGDPRVLEFYEGGASTVARLTEWANGLNARAAEVTCE